MKKIQNDYCIRLFADSSNTYRPQLNDVSLQDGYLYATNAHIVGKINAELCMHKYKAVENYPNAEKVISDHVSFEKKKVSVDILFNDLMKIECCFKPKMVECDKCDGEGVCFCEHCDSTYDCKECKGTGKMPSNELELTSEHDCILFNKKYKLQYLDLIVKTAVYTGVSEIEISNAKGLSGTLFTVGDFTILLMPIRLEED